MTNGDPLLISGWRVTIETRNAARAAYLRAIAALLPEGQEDQKAWGARTLLLCDEEAFMTGSNPQKFDFTVFLKASTEARTGNVLTFDRPVRAAALLAKIQALGRSGPPVARKIGTYSFWPEENLLKPDGGGDAVRLTEKEGAILDYLLRAQGAAVPRQELLVQVWAYADGVETHTLETHIYRLRQKIEADPAAPRIILTDEDGYRIEPLL